MLITLTIIGVIAALTIPTLMKNYEKRQIEVGLAKTYQELSNAMKRSEIDNGPFEDWNINWAGVAKTQEYVNTYFAPYIRLKQCTDKCFSEKHTNDSYFAGYINADGSVSRNIYASYFFPDGRSILFNVIIYDGGKYIEIIVDVNGKRGKSKVGEDVFAFLMGYSPKRMKKGFYTGGMYGGFGCIGISNEAAYKECKNYPLNCSVILQRNNWKFPDDYPIKF